MSMAAVASDRDGRAANRMDPDTKVVHARLVAWAKWARENLHSFPPITILGRMIEYGALGAAQAGNPPVCIPDDIAAVDAAVSRLRPDHKETIIAYYTHWEAPEVTARRLGMHYREMRAVLHRARHCLVYLLKL